MYAGACFSLMEQCFLCRSMVLALCTKSGPVLLFHEACSDGAKLCSLSFDELTMSAKLIESPSMQILLNGRLLVWFSAVQFVGVTSWRSLRVACHVQHAAPLPLVRLTCRMKGIVCTDLLTVCIEHLVTCCKAEAGLEYGTCRAL